MNDPQWLYPWPSNEHCYSHGTHEPVPESGAYRVCFECGHVFVTDVELRQAYIDNAPEDTKVYADRLVSADDISFCPHCLHDF